MLKELQWATSLVICFELGTCIEVTFSEITTFFFYKKVQKKLAEHAVTKRVLFTMLKLLLHYIALLA